MQAARNTEVAAGAVKKEPGEVVVEVDSYEEEAEKAVRRRKKKAACVPQTKRACVDCTKRCARIHGRDAASPSPLPSSSSSKAQARPTPAAPSFFKVMMGYFSEDMDIPAPFGRTILDLAGSNIYLEDAFGLRWRVRLCLRDGGVLSFGHGWKNFVLDHAVSCGEFLVFRQIARSVFTVQMFAPSAVERLYLCEKNKRQSRKRKPTQKTSSPAGIRTVKTAKSSVGNCKKKRRTDHPNGIAPPPRGCKMPVQVCVDDSEVPDSESELKCSETSQRVAEVGAARENPEAEDPPAPGHECKGQQVLDGQAEPADDCAIFEEKQSEHNAIARVTEHRISQAITEIENLPANVDATAPLSMMDVDEVSIDDIYLSADIYEFESDIYDTEALSVGLSMEGPIATGQNPGLNCLEDAPQNQLFPMGVGQGFVMPETLSSCTENKQVTDAPGTGTEYVCVSVHDIDINALPSNEPSLFGEENSSSPPADAEVHSNGCRFSSCNNDEGNNLSPVMNKQSAQKECSSMTLKQAKSHDGHGNTHDSTGHHAAEILPRSAKPHEFPDLTQNPLQIVQHAGNGSEGIHSGTSESGSILALAANSTKFCISVPAPGQTWLELPSRLPVLPRTKKQGRKVVILKDPSMRRWPVLYQCTPRFSGFITGWVDICSENNLREGDTCEFELSRNSELSFQVLVPTTQ
ncbi:hypothetical protein BS78_03G372100 [Paspalum vaginatum]|nr:hypothetical protein BS78_03G372100 [Paspalum vaginatum]KAJ1286702.1 hypothetical protein BS78_03G372100 [Paspalum vaginatum]